MVSVDFSKNEVQKLQLPIDSMSLPFDFFKDKESPNINIYTKHTMVLPCNLL